jgi:hypothetical protein
VKHITPVSLSEGIGKLQGELERQIKRHRAAANELLERLAVDEGHDKEEDSIHFVDFVDRADIGMIDGRSGAGLAHEAGAGLLVAHQVRGERFYCDGAMKLGVFSLIDDTHATFPDLFKDAVVEYRLSDHCF